MKAKLSRGAATDSNGGAHRSAGGSLQQGNGGQLGSTAPEGGLDQETRAAIQQIVKAVPRYLFRCWSCRSGGDTPGLNTPEAIRPLAFVKGTQRGPDIFHSTKKQIRAMAIGHLTGTSIDTEFSSWGASLAVAFAFIIPGDRDSYVSILDTKLLNKDTTKAVNIIMHVNAMSSAGLALGMYPHEYLAHGAIQGPALQAIPLSHFAKAGLTGIVNKFGHQLFPSHEVVDIAAPAVQRSKAIGHLCREEFVVPMTLAVLSLENHDVEQWRAGAAIPGFPAITEALQSHVLPDDVCTDLTILTDIVYVLGFPEIEQFIRLLRAFANHQKKNPTHRGAKKATPAIDGAASTDECTGTTADCFADTVNKGDEEMAEVPDEENDGDADGA